MPGRSWRAGQPCGDGNPVGPDRPLEKGVGGINMAAAEPQEAFVKDNETAEAEALEEAEVVVTVTVAVPWEAGQTVTVAVPRESVTEQEAAIELEAATELDEASEL